MIRKASLHDVYTTGVLIECPNCYMTKLILEKERQ